MTQTVDEFLAHHGVRGMKWGVRRNIKSAIAFRDRVNAPGHKWTGKEKAQVAAFTVGGTAIIGGTAIVAAMLANHLDTVKASKSVIEKGKNFVETVDGRPLPFSGMGPLPKWGGGNV